MRVPGCFPSGQERPDCQAGLPKERRRTYEQAVSNWRNQYNAQLKSGKHAAIILFAAEYPKDMVSDLPTALHPAAELPLICHSIDAALTLDPNQIIIAALAEHTEAIKQVVQTAYPNPSSTLDFVSIGGLGNDPVAYNEEGDGPSPIVEMQRKAAARVLAQDTPAVIELPCHWQIQGKVLASFAQEGKELMQEGFSDGCRLCPLDEPGYERGTCDLDYSKPNIIWGAAAWWRDRLQGLGPEVWQSSTRFPRRTIPFDEDEVTIITSRESLAGFERKLRAAEVQRHQKAGVTFREQSDGSTPALSAGIKIGRDSVIGYGVQIYGKTTIGRCVSIEGPTVIKDSIIGDNVRIGAFSHLDHVTLASNSGVGPFARLRAGASIDSGAYIGNFCELKSAHVGQGGNVCHLSYLGDADVGDRANIGAGTITCNYNGVAKNRTSIAAGAFIGSNSTLVAPLTVGEGALIAAGSVITSDVPADGLALGRSRQTTKESRAEATREKLQAEHAQKSTQRQ